VLIAGISAEIKLDISAEEINKNCKYAQNYVNYKNKYLNSENFCTLWRENNSE
jgi:hypothetical protein